MESFDQAVERARAYLAAGADAIFPEALQTREEFRDFAKAVEAPLLANMTEFGKTPLLRLEELAELGYRMVIYPQTAFRVSMHFAGQMLAELKSTRNSGRLARSDADAERTLRNAGLRSDEVKQDL